MGFNNKLNFKMKILIHVKTLNNLVKAILKLFLIEFILY